MDLTEPSNTPSITGNPSADERTSTVLMAKAKKAVEQAKKEGKFKENAKSLKSFKCGIIGGTLKFSGYNTSAEEGVDIDTCGQRCQNAGSNCIAVSHNAQIGLCLYHSPNNERNKNYFTYIKQEGHYAKNDAFNLFVKQ